MDFLHLLGTSVQPLASGLPAAQARGAAEIEPIVRGAEQGVQAWSRASDAYATLSFDSAVALWALGIAGAFVLAEWLLARTGRRR
jgi:hypothetical protein